MEFKGTKGEWFVGLNDDDPFYRRNVLEVGLKGHYPVAVLYGDGNEFNDETKANALLISKAPEMLEMLIECIKLAKFKGCDVVLEEIDKLIKSATEL